MLCTASSGNGAYPERCPAPAAPASGPTSPLADGTGAQAGLRQAEPLSALSRTAAGENRLSWASWAATAPTASSLRLPAPLIPASEEGLAVTPSNPAHLLQQLPQTSPTPFVVFFFPHFVFRNSPQFLGCRKEESAASWTGRMSEALSTSGTAEGNHHPELRLCNMLPAGFCTKRCFF